MKRSIYLLCSLTALTLVYAKAQTFPFWGNLEKGSFHVGFRVVNTYDLSRPAISERDELGHLIYMPGREPGRQIQITVWYPARPSAKRKMIYGDYIHEMAAAIDFTPLNEEGRKRAVAAYVDQVKGFDNPGFSADQLEEFSKLSTAAVRDEKEADGKFPLIIYPAYMAPASQSILAEYLASHGFVVVSTSHKGADSSQPEISPVGIEAQAADLGFVLAKAKEWTFVDGDRVAVMGVGFSATSCLALHIRNRDIDTFISLEGGVTVAGEKRMLQLTPAYDASLVNRPMMLIYSSHPDVSLATVDEYKYANRYFFHFPTMREFDHTDYGMLEVYSPNLIGKPLGDTKVGSEWSYRYVLNFLKFILKRDPAAGKFIENAPATNGAPEGLIIPSAKKGLPTLTLQELKELITERGLPGLTEAYAALMPQDPQPFSQRVMSDLYNWLGYRRDNDFAIRMEIVRIWNESYPQSSKGQFLLARLSAAKGNRVRALEAYREALRLLDSDTDPFLDNNTRTRIRTTASQEIAKG